MDTSEIRKNVKIMLDGAPYTVVDFQFVKPGKGQAFTRVKIRNLATGAVLERTFKSGEKLEAADVEERKLQYIYPEGENYVFMDPGSGDQVYVPQDKLGDEKQFLLDGLDVDVVLWNGNPVAISLPAHVTVQITHSEPGVKGDTASNVTKPATISTGAVIQVPLFINEGEWVKVDTRTGDYLERVNNKRLSARIRRDDAVAAADEEASACLGETDGRGARAFVGEARGSRGDHADVAARPRERDATVVVDQQRRLGAAERRDRHRRQRHVRHVAAVGGDEEHGAGRGAHEQGIPAAERRRVERRGRVEAGRRAGEHVDRHEAVTVDDGDELPTRQCRARGRDAAESGDDARSTVRRPAHDLARLGRREHDRTVADQRADETFGRAGAGDGHAGVVEANERGAAGDDHAPVGHGQRHGAHVPGDAVEAHAEPNAARGLHADHVARVGHDDGVTPWRDDGREHRRAPERDASLLGAALVEQREIAVGRRGPRSCGRRGHRRGEAAAHARPPRQRELGRKVRDVTGASPIGARDALRRAGREPGDAATIDVHCPRRRGDERERDGETQPHGASSSFTV